MSSVEKKRGGVKGLVRSTGKVIYGGGLKVKEQGYVWLKWGYSFGGYWAFQVASVSMIVLMPLLFEIMREQKVRSESNCCGQLCNCCCARDNLYTLCSSVHACII
jgi:hypothetical protein